MNELTTRWVAALRSDKYTQGCDYLKVNDKFCCLGVLCDIIDNTQWKDVGRGAEEYQRCSCTLSNEILEMVDITLIQQDHLVQLNDILRYSFKQIADEIEGGIPT